MSDIFICYSRTDSTLPMVSRNAYGRRAGRSFSMRKLTLVSAGTKNSKKELYAAKAVVALWSAKPRDSDFVLEETEYAKRKELLFPAFIEQVEYPYEFGRIQTADLIGWAGEQEHPGLMKLLTSLRLHPIEQTPR